MGVVFSPVLDELFVATRGEGATLNGQPISVSQVQNLSDALFCTEIGTSRDQETVTAIFSRLQALIQQVSCQFSHFHIVTRILYLQICLPHLQKQL